MAMRGNAVAVGALLAVCGLAHAQQTNQPPGPYQVGQVFRVRTELQCELTFSFGGAGDGHDFTAPPMKLLSEYQELWYRVLEVQDGRPIRLRTQVVSAVSPRPGEKIAPKRSPLQGRSFLLSLHGDVPPTITHADGRPFSASEGDILYWPFFPTAEALAGLSALKAGDSLPAQVRLAGNGPAAVKAARDLAPERQLAARVKVAETAKKSGRRYLRLALAGLDPGGKPRAVNCPEHTTARAGVVFDLDRGQLHYLDLEVVRRVLQRSQVEKGKVVPLCLSMRWHVKVSVEDAPAK